MEHMQGPNAIPPSEDVTTAAPSALDLAIAAADLTPARLAHALHLRPETIWRWRRGLSAPNGRHLIALAAQLSLEPAAVLAFFFQETQ